MAILTALFPWILRCVVTGYGCILFFQAVPVQALREGQPFPLVHVEDEQGRYVTLDLGAVHASLILVWATWCAPCHAAIPAFLSAVHSVQGRKPPTIVLWNIDHDTQRARHFVQRFVAEPTPGIVIRFDPGGREFQRLGAPGMPATFVVIGGMTRAVFAGYEPRLQQQVLQVLEAAVAR